MRRAIGVAVALLAATGCSSGTFVHVTITGAQVFETPPDEITLALRLSGRLATTTVAGKPTIALPTDVTLEIRQGAGELFCDAQLRAGGQVVSSAMGMTIVTRGKASELALDFGEMPDGGGPTSGLVTVVVDAPTGAGGKVLSSPVGVIDCGDGTTGKCSAQVEPGSALALQQVRTTGFFAGWSGDCAGFDATCTVDTTAARVVTARFDRANFIFYPSVPVSGAALLAAGTGATNAEKWVSAMDAICNQRAQAVGGAIAMGTYKAWISTAAESAKARIAATGARGWIASDGRIVMDTLDAATDAANPVMWNPVMTQELGVVDQTGPVLLTAATGSGETMDHCLDWTSTVSTDKAGGGSLLASSVGWTQSGKFNCDRVVGTNMPYNLVWYCMGVDRKVVVTPPALPPGARRAFLSSQDLDAPGVAGADAACASDATSAGLSGSWKALLATTTATAESRFNTNGQGFYRLDGVQITATPAEFFAPLAADSRAAPINLDVHGGYWPRTSASASVVAYTGALNGQTVSTSNCTNFTAIAGMGYASIVGLGGPFLYSFGGLQFDCDAISDHRVYCIEE